MVGRMDAITLVPAPSADGLPRLFDVQGDETVGKFIREHPHLGPLLHELRSSVDAQFGPETSVLLDVVTDPEEHDRALVARIRADLSIGEGLDALDRLLDAWWLHVLPRAADLLRIDVVGV